jgi:hypothetical protein
MLICKLGAITMCALGIKFGRTFTVPIVGRLGVSGTVGVTVGVGVIVGAGFDGAVGVASGDLSGSGVDSGLLKVVGAGSDCNCSIFMMITSTLRSPADT